jgi:hypothetical protein
LNKGKVVGGKPVVARCNSTALFDPVEEPLNPVASAVEQIGSLQLLFGGMLAYAPFFMASSLIQSAS